MTTCRLENVAIVHSGDKGDVCNIGIVPLSEGLSAHLREHLTVDVLTTAFDGLVGGPIERWELPGSGTLNFLLHRALAGGVTRSLALDGHGKSWSYLAGLIELDVPDELLVDAVP
jgi:hypothetical protein